MVAKGNVVIEVPIDLRNLIADERLHLRQPYYEVIEAAMAFWLDHGGWDYGRRPLSDPL